MQGVLQLSDEKRYDNRTEEEIIADLEERRNDHKFLTTEEAQEWNDQREKRSLSSSHWSVKRAEDRAKLEAMVEAIHKSYEYRLQMAAKWKALARQQQMDLDTACKPVLRPRHHSDLCVGDSACICGGR